ncbi:ladderlectin-like [Oncorhynchus keta]|uniref:ladderlectin-like n=1 Tax=Oncorhynchus keta TaxID=8018 RepID=UPI00227CBE3B|nr:ladderlectin-like [Oncorhynchus keta]
MEKLAILLLLSAAIALGDANLTQLLGLEPLLKTEVEQTPPVGAQVAAVQQGTKEMSCPSDWHPYGSRCFRFVSIPQSWSDSEQNCLALGGNLASVNNLLEYQFMQALTKNTNGHLPDTWIGGFDAVKEGLWMWSDGSRFDYTNWNTGEPNNAGEGEDCLQMNAASEKLWFDVPWVNSLLHLSPPGVNSLLHLSPPGVNSLLHLSPPGVNSLQGSTVYFTSHLQGSTVYTSILKTKICHSLQLTIT